MAPKERGNSNRDSKKPNEEVQGKPCWENKERVHASCFCSVALYLHADLCTSDSFSTSLLVHGVSGASDWARRYPDRHAHTEAPLMVA